MPKIARSSDEIELVRDSIVQGAIELIVEEGLENFSMNRLGARMNMTGANLYNYFDGREALILAIHKKSFRALHDEMAEAVSSESAALARLKALVKAFVTFGTRNANIYELLFNAPRQKFKDYLGTPLEEMARDEYASSLNALFLAARIVGEFLETRVESGGERAHFLTIKLLSEVHGIISLYNSGVLFDITEEPEVTLDAVADAAVESLAIA